jgi:site-specific recombinase XerD
VTYRTRLITIRYIQNIIPISSANNGWSEAHFGRKVQITPGSGQYAFVNLRGGRRGIAMSHQTACKLVARIRERTGAEFTVHMLRHTHATDLVRRGVPIEVVARLLTHRSSVTASQIYIHLEAGDIRDALNRAGVWNDGDAR